MSLALRGINVPLKVQHHLGIYFYAFYISYFHFVNNVSVKVFLKVTQK